MSSQGTGRRFGAWQWVTLLITSALLIGASGCSNNQHRSGVISGIAHPCAALNVPAPNRLVNVELRNASGRLINHQSVRAPWAFRFSVAPGEYTVSAPKEHSRRIQLRVTSNATRHVFLGSPCK